MKRTMTLVSLAVLMLAQTAYADRGLWVIRWRIIPLDDRPRPRPDDRTPPDWDPYDGVAAPRVTVEEPSQKAFLAWNGREEILLLSTDLRASHQAQVLEVMPLPSEPKVEKGDVKVFARAQRLIDEKQPRRSQKVFAPTAPGGDEEAFVSWVEQYLKGIGVANPTIPEPMKKTIGQYLQEGFKWFVFDVVEVGRELAAHDAIQYRFKTDYVYYPLKITRDVAGESVIGLYVVTAQGLRRFEGIPRNKVRVVWPPVTLNSRELRQLDSNAADLLRDSRSVQLRYWEIVGRLADFEADVIARP
jgi:hypothetical protein